MYVDVRGGLQGGLWAPNGCEVLEPVFVCLYVCIQRHTTGLTLGRFV
jgi:hypothetical protein